MKGFLSEPLERRQSVTNTTTCNRHNVEWMVALDQLPCALWTVADHTVVLTLQWGEILPEHDQEKCVLLYEALSLGPVNWAELRENLSEQLAVHEKGDLVQHEKVLLGAPAHVKVDQALEA